MPKKTSDITGVGYEHPLYRVHQNYQFCKLIERKMISSQIKNLAHFKVCSFNGTDLGLTTDKPQIALLVKRDLDTYVAELRRIEGFESLTNLSIHINLS